MVAVPVPDLFKVVVADRLIHPDDVWRGPDALVNPIAIDITALADTARVSSRETDGVNQRAGILVIATHLPHMQVHLPARDVPVGHVELRLSVAINIVG